MTPFSTRTAVDPALELRVASHSRHTCKLCGGGCRSYDVMLTEREARRLDLAMWRPLLHDVPDDAPLVVLDEATHQYTLNKVNDRCVFLDTDELCIVHKSAGMDAKPIACQFFPLQAVQAPDGLHLSLNVGCRRLVEMTDADSVPDLDGARRLLSQVQAVTTIGETLPLAPDHEISYAEFSAWQAKLLGLLTVPESEWRHVWERLRAAADLLLIIPADALMPGTEPVALFQALHRLTVNTPPVRHTLTALYRRSEPWLTRLMTASAPFDAPIMDQLAAPPQFIAMVARQSLEGQQAALHRTARTGWVALLAALIGGLYGAVERIEQTDQRPDHALNEAISDATDLFLSPAGQIALTEPNQQAFLLALSTSH